ncbi:hypothetical protein AAFX91_21740 [Bradyrhizobium sp. 31Argb]|uniref:hypothetical protein n=1 Tax=Bradyrhizobium sp. 31Argb TaxID=3141247 RepID=UPI0037478B35
MTAGAPAYCDDLVIRVDVIAVSRYFIVLRDQLTWHQISFLYDEAFRLGSSPSGDCYELTLPRWLAIEKDISDV